VSGRVEIRREMRPGDLGRFLALNAPLHTREHGVDREHEAFVEASVGDAARRGFPGPREEFWVVERDGEFAGCVALTDEGSTGVVRWFVLAPSVRGLGLGRRLLGELIERARELGYERLRLETYSLLRAAIHLFRSFGFRLVDEDTAPRWGHDAITYQYYELDLARAERPVAA
jgi:N-acetylglutamate synthase-like GNAT family acetyltransferase